MTSHPEPARASDRIVELRFPARAARLHLVRALVEEVARENGMDESDRQQVTLAVDEACQNVIRHAYRGAPDGELVLSIRRRDDALVFDLLDFAAPVDVRRVRPRPLHELRPGGLGTHFIRVCMDEWSFQPPPEGVGNLLRMVKRLPRGLRTARRAGSRGESDGS